jgi:hypothetical protein
MATANRAWVKAPPAGVSTDGENELLDARRAKVSALAERRLVSIAFGKDA